MLKSFLDELSGFVYSLSEREPERFSAPLHWVLLGNGDADFHDNVIFFGFDEGQTDPVLVAKVPRLAENGWMLKTEYDHLVELWSCIGEKAAHYVPRPFGLVTLQARPVLVLSYVPGESLTRLSPRSFWRNRAQVSALAAEAAGTLRELNRLTERPVRPGESLRSRFAQKADQFGTLFQLTSEEERALSDLVGRVETRLETPSHKVLIQGDFWHGNMIRSRAQGNLMFVDWQFARWSGDVSMDVYFFLLAGALSATEDGLVEARAKAAANLLSNWRADVVPDYLSAYGKPEHYSLLPQREGMLMCCVEKAVRSALEFGYSHPDDRMWRCLFAELLNWQDAT
jgi:hypothetical protein